MSGNREVDILIVGNEKTSSEMFKEDTLRLAICEEGFASDQVIDPVRKVGPSSMEMNSA